MKDSLSSSFPFFPSFRLLEVLINWLLLSLWSFLVIYIYFDIIFWYRAKILQKHIVNSCIRFFRFLVNKFVFIFVIAFLQLFFWFTFFLVIAFRTTTKYMFFDVIKKDQFWKQIYILNSLIESLDLVIYQSRLLAYVLCGFNFGS